MGVGLSAVVRIGWQRRAAARGGILAILLQAFLFAWHHHAPPFHANTGSAAASKAIPASPVLPGCDDHDCQICFTLGHHGAVPVDFFAADPPEQTLLHETCVATVDTPLAPYLLFRSRAPPVA